MAKALRDCPCFSGLRYAGCCGPFHRGEREPASPEALMRSRYAAFSLGLATYVLHTLSADHPDRDLPRDAYLYDLARARDRRRFMGLRILHAAVDGDAGEVMFFARLFEKGVDRSFVELSDFARERAPKDGHPDNPAAWRYTAGIVVEGSKLPGDLDALRPEDVRREAGLQG